MKHFLEKNHLYLFSFYLSSSLFFFILSLLFSFFFSLLVFSRSSLLFSSIFSLSSSLFSLHSCLVLCFIFSLLFAFLSCLVFSCLVLFCFSVVFSSLCPCLLSLCLLLSLSLSPCGVVVVSLCGVVSCVLVCCVCCGVCVRCRGAVAVWRVDSKPPCVDSKLARMYVQNVPVCTGTTRSSLTE